MLNEALTIEPHNRVNTIELTVLKLKSDHLPLYYLNPSMFRIEATLLNEDFPDLSSLSF